MDAPELHSRLLKDAQTYDHAAHNRRLLDPYRDVILTQRANYMSYEQIAATFSRHGFKVSPSAIGVFCRRTYTKAEITRVRQKLKLIGNESTRLLVAPSNVAPALGASASGMALHGTAKRGPKIARDNY